MFHRASACLVLFLAVLLALAVPPASAAPGVAGPPVSVLDPSQLDPTVTSVGTCTSASLVSGRVDAWSCSVAAPTQFGANVLDPCYSLDASSGQVVCPLSYPGGMTAAAVTLTQPLACDPTTDCDSHPGHDQPRPAVLELSDGTRCRAAPGGRWSVGAEPVTYACADGSWLLGDPQILADSSWQITQTPAGFVPWQGSLPVTSTVVQISQVWEE